MPGPCRGLRDRFSCNFISLGVGAKCSVEVMSASTDFNSDYWSTNAYAYHHMYNRQQFYPDESKANNYAALSNNLVKDGTGGSFNTHQSGYPTSFVNDLSSYQVKGESVYNTCRYINQGYSNVDARTDKSISPPPINHTFTNNLNQFDSCRQGYTSLATSLSSNDSRPSSTVNECDDSPVKTETSEAPSALRALLSKPGGKIPYDYTNLHNTMQEGHQRTFNDVYNDESKAKNKATSDGQGGGEDLTVVQNNFYPWMKTNGEFNIPLLTNRLCLLLYRVAILK